MGIKQLCDLTIFSGTVGGMLAVAWATAEGVRQWLKPDKPEAKWTVTLIDPDGIPMRQESVSAKGVARIVEDLNSGYLK